MMYEELLSTLREYAEWADENIYEVPITLPDALRKAADAIEELQQIAAHYEQTAKDYWKEACDYKAEFPRWINVKDHLPHAIGGESDDVLTLNRFGEYNLLFFDGTKWCRRNGEPYTTNPLFEIVCWMLPGAPDGFKPWRRDCHEECAVREEAEEEQ